MDNSSERLVHIFWWSLLTDVLKPSFNLITHCTGDIIAWNQTFIIDQSFSPNLSINFIICFQMLADIIFSLGNFAEFFLPMNVHS